MKIKKEKFQHAALNLKAEKPLVYTALSKHLFYYRMFITKYVLENNCIPLNPFMIFDYFLLNSIENNVVREANNNLVKRSDEIWVFGEINDGVLAEVLIAKEQKKIVRFFKVDKSNEIQEVKNIKKMNFEKDVLNNTL